MEAETIVMNYGILEQLGSSEIIFYNLPIHFIAKETEDQIF